MTDSTDNALKRCPFCGSSEIEDVMRTGYVQCQYCLASAKNRTAWSRRADLAPDPLADARVQALVSTVREVAQDAYGYDHLYETTFHRDVHQKLSDSLAALSPTGGDTDG